MPNGTTRRQTLALGLAAGGSLLAGRAQAATGFGTVTLANSVDLQTLDGSQNVTTYHRIFFKHVYDPLITIDPAF